ncbi:putative transposase (partial), partial [Bordetella parapertussis]
KGIAIRYIQPSKPNQNAFIERFNRTYRTEVLDAHLFANLELVQAITDQCLVDYNQYPYAQIAGWPPAEAIHASVNPRSGRLSDNVYLTGGGLRQQTLMAHCLCLDQGPFERPSWSLF